MVGAAHKTFHINRVQNKAYGELFEEDPTSSHVEMLAAVVAGTGVATG